MIVLNNNNNSNGVGIVKFNELLSFCILNFCCILSIIGIIKSVNNKLLILNSGIDMDKNKNDFI